jgi:hypothetical protein
MGLLHNMLPIYGNYTQTIVPYAAYVPRTEAIVYCRANIECAIRRYETKTPAKSTKLCPSVMVYSPTRDSVLSNKR